MRKASFRQQIKRPFRKAALWFQRALPHLRAQTRPLYVQLGILRDHA